MALQTMIEKLNTARDEYEAQLGTFGAKTRKDLAKLLAENIPLGFALKWSQNTPSFSDGDPCRFSVNEPSLVRVKEVDDFDEDDDYNSSLGRVIERYGTPDREESYEENDYSKPTGRPGEYAKKTLTYISKGFPRIEGCTKKQLQALEKTFKDLPEDLLEKVFGDGAKVTIQSDGEVEVEEYYE